MGRLTKTYEDGSFGVADDLPCGENSYEFKQLLIDRLGEYEEKRIGISRIIKEGRYYCPKCNREMNRIGHCINCGQRLY